MTKEETGARCRAIIVALLCMGGCMSGCATVSNDALIREQAVQNSEHRLAQRERELVRARSDLTHFRTTLRHLREHESGWSRSKFNPFLVRFLEERIDPLVSNEWQTSHPELSQLDVDLRLLRAEAFLDLRMNRDASRAVKSLEATADKVRCWSRTQSVNESRSRIASPYSSEN